MTYQLIEEYTCTFTGGPMQPKGWAIHWWGDPAQNPTFYGIVRVLLNRSELKQASVNFMAEDSLVACLVDPFTIAWAQGDGGSGWGNNNLVSIECNPRCTAGDRETVAELIADQHIKNGIPITLYPHKNFTSTQCPGVWEQWIPWLTDRAKQIVAAKTNGQPVGTEDEMTPEQAAQLAYIASPEFKAHIWAGTTDVEQKARTQFINNLLNSRIVWQGFEGKVPDNGRNFTTIATDIGWADTRIASLSKQVAALAELVKQLSVAQGVVIDYAAIAKAVADEQAQRLSE